MRNRVGPPVSGSDFFSRDALMDKLCRRLNNGDNLYLVAPSRSGKTSIMYQLMEAPCPGYTFVYVNTEAIDDEQIFFKKVTEEVLNSPVISGLQKTKKALHQLKDSLLGRIKKISFIELNQKAEENYSDIFADLLSKIDPVELKLVIMIDEFPSTVANIVNKTGEAAAIHFLQINRTLRQTSTNKVQMIYTGSIGLPALVSRLVASKEVNDLYNFEIPPLTLEEGFELCKKLFVNEGIAASDDLIKKLLGQINWLMPFFIQLAVSQLADIYFDNNRQALAEKHLKEAIERSSGLRNNTHFESYYQRINLSFQPDEAEYAHELLRQIAHRDAIPVEEVYKDADAEEVKRRRFIITSLELDGYITPIDGKFRFHSPILQQWWKRYSY